jgi:thiol-disulfide isomerase/thioredoxin
MTTTIVFWLRALVILFMLHTLWAMVQQLRRQKSIKPVDKKGWTNLLSNIGYLCVGIFLFIMITDRFQKPLDIVLKNKDKPLTGLSFINLSNNQTDSLAAYKNKPVIINVWATWCGPCRRELPDLEELQAKYGKENLTVLAVSDEEEDVLKNYMDEKKLKLIVGKYFNHPMIDSLSSRPVSILIDPDGNIKDVVAGARGYNFFNNWVKEYVKL